MGKLGGIGIVMGILAIGLSSLPLNNELGANEFNHDLIRIHQVLDELPMMDSIEIFALSSRCSNCHGLDELGQSLVDAQGNDVNMFDDWRSSMMANSAKDPFWLAKVSQETKTLPAHATDIESKCTTCHAPLGHYKAKLEGAPHYTIAMMEQDSFGLDGVSCGACHHQSELDLGDLFSGQLNFDTNRVAYGPHLFPFAQPMVNFVGFEPVYSDHILDAGICAGCHTLVTEPFDLEGNPTGESFIEQATYHEWLNSTYNDTISCQSCHMPVLDESVVVASGQTVLFPRKPYGLHEMVGANTFMLELMKTHRDTLDINASDLHYDASIAATMQMLQQRSLELDLSFLEQSQDSALFQVQLLNKAGHKFPSGYPSRRAFIEFVVASANDTLFASGRLDPYYELVGFDPSENFEPHHQEITSSDQVQIYELVNGNVEGNFSNVLEQATVALKDNRLAPIGFSKSHMVYDTTRIVGLADIDPDFNMENGVEGSGTDDVFFKVPLNAFVGEVTVTAKVYYQALPPNWMKELFEESSLKIDQFKAMYDAADQQPVLVQADTLSNLMLGVNSLKHTVAAQQRLKIYPNPIASILQIEFPDLVNKTGGISIYTSQGVLVRKENVQNSLDVKELSAGVYILVVDLGKDRLYSGRFIKL